jgi:hypothetical protein
MTTLLTRRAVVLATLETTYNVAASQSATTDAILVEAPDFMADMTVLMRDYARASLSPLAHQIGRKLAKLAFTTELRGSGVENSGVITDAPRIARLFQACGYVLTAMSAVTASSVFDIGAEANEISWVSTLTSPTNTDVIQYILAVTVGGASGTAQIAITSDTGGEGSAAAVVTTATPITVGTKGMTLTPTFTGPLLVGQRWVIWLLPRGCRLDPESSAFKSLTLSAWLDGTEALLTGCLGTFSIDATAGQYGKIKWEFTGQYTPVIDAALPSATYEKTLPPSMQLARLNVDGFSATVNALTFTQGNDIQPRPDINNTDGYNGVRIVSRKPAFGVDPEADLVANHDFWGRMAAATQMPFQFRAGNVIGNTVWVLAPSTQYSKMTYKDRQGIRAYDAGLAPAAINGDDEIAIVFI